jgi:hypothetical protein
MINGETRRLLWHAVNLEFEVLDRSSNVEIQTRPTKECLSHRYFSEPTLQRSTIRFTVAPGRTNVPAAGLW